MKKDTVSCSSPLGMGHSVFPPVFTFFGAGLLNQLLPAPQIPAIFLLFCPDLLLWSNPTCPHRNPPATQKFKARVFAQLQRSKSSVPLVMSVA